MTPSQLKAKVEQGKDSYFFTRDTMKFFGDTMRNYGVRSNGNSWELYRKKPVKYGLINSAHFDKQTFNRIILNKEGV
jgi:hypothetical protein